MKSRFDMKSLSERLEEAVDKAKSGPPFDDLADYAKYLKNASPEALSPFHYAKKKIKLVGVTFDESLYKSDRGLMSIRLSNVDFKDCKFVGKGGDGPETYFSLNLNGCRFDNCVFDQSTIGTTSGGSYSDYAHVDYENVVFNNCTFIGRGCKLLNRTATVKRPTFVNCSFSDGKDIQIEGQSPCSNCVAKDCTFIVIEGEKVDEKLFKKIDFGNSKLTFLIIRDSVPKNLFDGVDVGSLTLNYGFPVSPPEYSDYIDPSDGSSIAFWKRFTWKGTKGLNSVKGLSKNLKLSNGVKEVYSVVVDDGDGYAASVKTYASFEEAEKNAKPVRVWIVKGTQQENEPIGQTDEGNGAKKQLV